MIKLWDKIDKKSLIKYSIILLLLLGIIFGVRNYYNNKLDISEQNLKAAQTELKEVKLKNGELLAYRDSYIAKINDLENLLGISKKEIKELQKNLDSKIAYISNIESKIKIEYIETVRDSIVYITKDSAESKFKYYDEWVALMGKNRFKFNEEFSYNTTIESLEVAVPLNVGLTNDYQIFVKTPNPYIQFTTIDGAVIDKSILKPKKQRWSHGFHFGFGVQWGILNKSFDIGPQIGYSVHFNL